jgi:gliding motility-associated-like protein
VTWTVTDIHGNLAFCKQTVTVTDIEKPTIAGLFNIETHTDRGVTYASVNLGTPSTNDNCGVASTTNNAPVKFPIGTTIVTWVVRDIHGNLDSTTQTVTVSQMVLVANDDFDSTYMNIPVTVNFIKNDINPNGNDLLATLCGGPRHGTIQYQNDSILVYAPENNYQGPDEIRYSLYDPLLKAISDTATIYIHVGGEFPIIIHNVITPNGDGLNDKWIISGIEKYPANTVQVFNRWGDKIKSYVGYDNTNTYWDGNNKHDEPVPDGTYFYIINIDNVGKFSGWIYLRANTR